MKGERERERERERGRGGERDRETGRERESIATNQRIPRENANATNALCVKVRT